MNAGQLRAIAAQLPQADSCPVKVEAWNDYGAVLVTIGDPGMDRQMIVRPDGAVFPWTGGIVDLVADVLDRAPAYARALREHP